MSATAYGIECWSSEGWRAEAEAWLDEQLAIAGLERTGGVRQPHVRPWATALAAPTSGGTVWLKAAGPGTAFEIDVYELLSCAAPDDVLAPIAIDIMRGWILLPDGGTPLGERVWGSRLVEAFADALYQYGVLQRTLAPDAGRLLALGIADMRPTAMPQRFQEAVDAVRSFVVRTGAAADRHAYERAAAMGKQVAGWCERLADAPGAPSLDHNDLHPWNVLVSSNVGGRARFYDWGGVVLAHPFASMLVPLTFMQAHELACDPDDPRLARLRDAYLDAFADLAGHAELVETLELACRVAKIARALTWNRVFGACHPADAEERWTRAPLTCFVSLPDNSYLGGV